MCFTTWSGAPARGGSYIQQEQLNGELSCLLSKIKPNEYALVFQCLKIDKHGGQQPQDEER